MNQLVQIIASEGLLMVLALWVVGEFIKALNKLDPAWVPFILLGISLVLTPLTLGGYNAQNIVQAILITGFAVLGNQLFKQGKNLLDGFKNEDERQSN